MSDSEPILILYASMRGTALTAAEAIEMELSDKLESVLSQRDVTTKYTPRLVEMDKFIADPQWTRVAIIVVSSYGSGDAPRGGRQFRAKCDKWLQDNGQALKGLQFALCGLGDSKYMTFLKNPTTTQNALIAQGAEMIGTMGAADAHPGLEVQQDSLKAWRDALWEPLADAIMKDPVSAEDLEAMNKATKE
jgi:sulfite reductase alpha subunit-like flavoprotein